MVDCTTKIELNKMFPAVLIDVFEDFLTEKNVKIPNDEHEGDEGEAIIYGSDFDQLMGMLSDTCNQFGIKISDSWDTPFDQN